jgi:hypothetical protein
MSTGTDPVDGDCLVPVPDNRDWVWARVLSSRASVSVPFALSSFCLLARRMALSLVLLSNYSNVRKAEALNDFGIQAKFLGSSLHLCCVCCCSMLGNTWITIPLLRFLPSHVDPCWATSPLKCLAGALLGLMPQSTFRTAGANESAHFIRSSSTHMPVLLNNGFLAAASPSEVAVPDMGEDFLVVVSFLDCGRFFFFFFSFFFFPSTLKELSSSTVFDGDGSYGLSSSSLEEDM